MIFTMNKKIISYADLTFELDLKERSQVYKITIDVCDQYVHNEQLHNYSLDVYISLRSKEDMTNMIFHSITGTW